MAEKYSNEFQRLWDEFKMVISKEEAIEKIQEIEKKKNRGKKEKKKKKKIWKKNLFLVK